MIRRLSVMAVFSVIGSLAPAFAQTPTPSPSPTPSPTPADGEPVEPNYDTITYWKAELPGGTYVVAHDSINSVSSQQYVLDGAARVTEVNVSTSGSLQPRFYFIEPLQLIDSVPGAQVAERVVSAAQAAASRVLPGDPVWAKVIKEYPITTHAGTIEYRLESAATLQALYQSLESSWIAGRSEVYRPGGAGAFDTDRKNSGDDDESDPGSTNDATNDPTDPGA